MSSIIGCLTVSDEDKFVKIRYIKKDLILTGCSVSLA